MATITVTVNIAEADAYEGNAECRLVVKSTDLHVLDRKAMNAQLEKALDVAIKDYWRNNSPRRTK